MVSEAEAHKEVDEKRKEQVELKNKAEQYISSIEEGLQEQGDKIDAAQKEQTEKLLAELKEAVEKEDYDTLRQKIGDLEKAAEFMAQQHYQQSAETDHSDGSEAGYDTPKDDDVVDADFTESEDK